MKEGVSYSVAEFFGALKGWFFLLSLAFIAVAFIFDVILSLKSEKFYKKRGWYFVVLSGLVLFESGIELFALKGEFLSDGIAFPITLSGVGTLVYTPLFFIKPCIGDSEDNEEKFVADGEVMRDLNKRAVKETLLLRETEPEIKSEKEIDFTHVKSVIDKLNGYPLSPADKKTVKELKYAVSAAENGDRSDVAREKINDGLGAILKIMSRYGV